MHIRCIRFATPELLRSRILMLLESVDRESHCSSQREHLTFVVVGAGPTGTETAGALGDMTQRLLKVYRDLPFSKSRVILVDAIHKVLNTFSQGSQIYASEMLKKHGVELLLGAGVQEVHPSHVIAVRRKHNSNPALQFGPVD